MQATITVGAGTHPNATLDVGASYVIYRWEGYRNIPARPDLYSTSNYTSRHAFVASAPSYTFEDPTRSSAAAPPITVAQRSLTCGNLLVQWLNPTNK